MEYLASLRRQLVAAIGTGAAVVVKVPSTGVGRIPRVAQLTCVAPLRVRVWVGRPPILRGKVRWSNKARTVALEDVVRPATDREVAIGIPL